MDNEIEIQTKRIIKIINQTIRKLKIISHLPGIANNDQRDVLLKYFLPVEVDLILAVCQRQRDSESYSFSSATSNTEDKFFYANKMKKMVDEKTDFFMTQMLEIIFASKPFINDLESLHYQEQSSLDFIEEVENLKEVIQEKLLITGEEELIREKRLREAYRTDIILSERITEIESELKKQREDLGVEEERKRQKVEELKEKMEQLKEKFQQELNDMLLKSEKKMMLNTLSSESRQAELNYEANDLKKQYEMLLEDHLSTEKTLRAKRLKMEAQLAGWVAKYDQDVGDRQTEYEQLQAEYDKAKADFEELQDKADEQEEIYEKLMAEKNEEEIAIFNEKLMKFLSHRAAKIIQRAWREYRENKKKKKKAKGKAKGSGKRAPAKKKK